MQRKSIFDSRHMEVVSRIKAGRERLGLTQAEFAARLGRGQSFVAKIEKGQRRIDVIELLDMALALSVSPAQLMPLPPSAGGGADG